MTTLYKEMTDEIKNKIESYLYDTSHDSMLYAVTTVAAEMGLGGDEYDTEKLRTVKADSVVRLAEDVFDAVESGDIVPRGTHPDNAGNDVPDAELTEEDVALVDGEELAQLQEKWDEEHLARFDDWDEEYDENDPAFDVNIDTSGFDFWLNGGYKNKK